ncbi:MAG: ferritin-like domain-containing protein [Leptolyngbyaceae cyanobacterium bins.59]|nr:ferritin-like domain-containing protein [Leptolyngbyaceae cyanobacterium bins.59]
MRIGSQEHKELFCHRFMATHRPYEPETLSWPDLDEGAIERLLSIPFWGEAIRIERRAGEMVSAFAATIDDPLIREAVALQGREENRHGRLIRYMTERYNLNPAIPDPEPLPTQIEPAFVQFGYGECIDSSFAFGLFEIGKQTGWFPDSLLSIFDTVLDEEARHITFFVNWIAYERKRRGLAIQPIEAILTLKGYGRALLNLVKTFGNTDMGGSGFTAKGGSVFEFDLTPEKFLTICLQENDRRMSQFDDRLLRPQLLPSLGRVALNVLKLKPGRKAPTLETQQGAS